MVATISNSSCSVESTSVNNPEKTGRVQETKKETRTISNYASQSYKIVKKKKMQKKHLISCET